MTDRQDPNAMPSWLIRAILIKVGLPLLVVVGVTLYLVWR